MDDATFQRERATFQKHARARQRAVRAKVDARPFIVKYRPEKLQDVVGHEAVVARLSTYVRSLQLPNLLFEGPPGVGKTTCGTCLANETLREHRARGFLWLNASDDRTAQFVQTAVKEFIGKVIALPKGCKRVVFLDEVDSMTRDAQMKLKRLLDSASSTATFILACNDLAKVEEPVQARCVHFAFGCVPPALIAQEVRRVAAAEKLALADTAVSAIVRITGGDVRKGLNALQACADAVSGGTCRGAGTGAGAVAGAGAGTGEGAGAGAVLDGAGVCKLCDVPDADAVSALVALCARGDAFGAVAAADALVDAGHSVHDVLRTLHEILRPAAAHGPSGSAWVAPAGRSMHPAVRYRAFAQVGEVLGSGRRLDGPVFREATGTVHVFTRLHLRSCVARICEAIAPVLGGPRSPFALLVAGSSSSQVLPSRTGPAGTGRR